MTRQINIACWQPHVEEACRAGNGEWGRPRRRALGKTANRLLTQNRTKGQGRGLLTAYGERDQADRGGVRQERHPNGRRGGRGGSHFRTWDGAVERDFHRRSGGEVQIEVLRRPCPNPFVALQRKLSLTATPAAPRAPTRSGLNSPRGHLVLDRRCTWRLSTLAFFPQHAVVRRAAGLTTLQIWPLQLCNPAVTCG